MNKEDYEKKFENWTGDEETIKDEIKRMKGEKMIMGDELFTTSNESLLKYLEELFKKKLMKEYYVDDLVKMHDGGWGIVLKRRLIPKSEDKQ